MRKDSLVISSTFTAEPIAEMLHYWIERLSLPYQFEFTAFNQVFQELLDPRSLISTNANGINALLVRLEDWDQCRASLQAIEKTAVDFVGAVQSAAERTHAPFLIFICPSSTAFMKNAETADALRSIENQIAARLDSFQGVRVMTSPSLLKQYPVAEYDDPGAQKLAQIPYTRDFFAALGTSLCRQLFTLRNHRHKVLVLDCDHTLWKGVCGEVGAAGIEIDEHYRALQEFALRQREAGMLLCLASKNDERDVDAVFSTRSDMLLKPEHFVARRINWLPKSENIRSLAAELNLGLDSFVLIDDSLIECSEVEARHPEVLTLQLPSKSQDIPRFLQNAWNFSDRPATREDNQRALHYQQNAQRELERKGALTFSDFLASLDLRVTVSPMKPEHIARVAQLTQRTNQFNTTTLRRSEAEVRQLCGPAEARPMFECLVVDVKDRFGDYGLVGAIIFSTQAATLSVDSFMLSCRALGRGIEHRMVASLGELAAARELKLIEIPFVMSERNEPARIFLEGLGAEYLERHTNGFVCQLPIDIARTLKFSTEAAKPSNPRLERVESERRAEFRDSSQWVSSVVNETLKRLASELGTVEQILTAVDNWKRKSRPDVSGDYVAPRNAAERNLARIWEQVLGIDRVGIFDNFFELGGNSILGALLINRLSRDASLHMLFEAPTIAALAQATETNSNHGRTETVLPVIVPDLEHRNDPFPLTDIQQAYLVGRTGSIELGSIGCHVYEEIDVNGLDLKRFNVALQKVIERHDTLRTVILEDGRQQILDKVPPVALKVYDLRGADAETCAAHLGAIRETMSHQVLPADRAPLLEFRATMMDDESVWLHRSTDRLISDALSDQILMSDLWALYENPDAPLPELKLSFRDYVLAEASIQRTDLFARSEAYWKKAIPGLPPAPELPVVRSAGLIAQPRFERRSIRFASETWQRLKRNAASAGVSPNSALLAAYADVIGTWSKNRRFSLNLTVFNRSPMHPQVNEVIGDGTSVNILAVEPRDEENFTARARRLQSRLWEDLDHRYFSGVSVLRELVRAEKGTPRAIMPVVFTSTLHLDELRAAGEKRRLGRTVYGITQTAQVWLDNQVSEDDGQLVINWDAVEELFPAGLLDDMFQAYVTLIHRLALEVEAWRGETVRIIPVQQLEQRAEVNATASPVPEGLLHTFFESQVEQRQKQVAVAGADRALTYEELSNCANGIAAALRQHGAQPNTLVAVVMNKGWEQVAAVLGILKSGAAYLPIDAEMPRERMWYLLDNAQVRLVVSTEGVNRRLEWPPNVQRIVVNPDDAQRRSVPLKAVQSAQDLAYVIYTSGSTGNPKGVMIDHRGAVNTIVDINQRFKIGPDDRVLALSSLSFDLSVYDIFGTLAAGGTIVMPDAELSKDPAHWLSCVKDERVTIWNTVPTLIEMLANHVLNIGEKLPDSLRVIMMSGDWIPLSLPPKLKSLAKDAELISLGGATEASIWSILYPIKELDPSWKSVPYGRPMVNQSFHVLNEKMEPCPIWVPGFLYIGGIGLAKGYWRDSAKTNASFISHPATGERLYRTGDMGRYMSDGNIEFLGRVDQQVKIRGFRIELGEIEAALALHPQVKECVVAAREDTPGEKRLVAYVVLRGGSEPAAGDWRGYLQEKLPDYMIPSAFVALNALPLSSNGKVDRRALPRPDQQRSEVSAGFVAPRSKIEESLTTIWAELLNLKQLGVNDDVFDLGAHSLTVFQMKSRIQETFNIDLSFKELFDASTVALLAKSIEGARS